MEALNEAVESSNKGTKRQFDKLSLTTDERYQELRKVVLKQLGRPFTPFVALPPPAASAADTHHKKRVAKPVVATEQSLHSRQQDVVLEPPPTKRSKPSPPRPATTATTSKTAQPASKPGKDGERTCAKPTRTKGTRAKPARGKAYRAAPSQAVLQRMGRSTQRLYLVRRQQQNGGMRFDVMGTNGNLYDVTIGLQPHCTCPDYTKRQGTVSSGACKHLIFVYLRVLKLDKRDPRWWQSALIESELVGLFNAVQQIGQDDEVMADSEVRQQLERRERKNRKDVEGECCICFDEMTEREQLSYCEACGNNFHKVCLDNWSKEQPGEARCALCRQPLQVKKDDYLNLAQFSSAHTRQLTLAEMYHDTHMHMERNRRRE